MKKTRKRITAFSISIMLMFNMAASSIPVSAATGSKIYTHDGYTIEYTVRNEWTGNQNVEVKITNTSSEVMSGWAVGYNAFGEINGLWNAQMYGHKGTEYILSAASYNCEIEPGQSANFGYNLSGDNFKIPQDIVNCAERVDINEGYNVYYNIIGDYESTYQAEMVIENTSDKDISSWRLSFDGNASIDNLWNGKLLENSNGSFKVKNAENNVVISAGSSTSFSFSGTKNSQNAPDMSESVENLPPVVTEESSETDAANSETVLTQNDIADNENATSETGETEIETVPESVVTPASGVVFNNYRFTGVVIPMEFDFEIDPEVDSDNDGLPDYLEKEIGTDRYNADTDGDDLPDGYEYFTLGTDPKKSDSDDNGISDADEDFDEDGLTNLEEYEIGTDPFSNDTDYDGLSDYDEVKIHNTDPLKYDTDGDKVSDGDEVILGIDPNNSATHGYPDSEYTTVQTVGEDSPALDYINNIEDNPYKVTVEITAAGVADNNLTAGESGYSYQILHNDAVLGVVPEFDYCDGLSVTDVVIKFKLDDSAVDNKLGVYADVPELNGINRLQVFKYFEDNNILLPIETFYDEEAKTVYTHVDELGTYYLMDMEIWINHLNNIEPENYYVEDDEANSVNIVFCLDPRYISGESNFDGIKSDMKAIADFAFNRYSDVKIYVYHQELGINLKAEDNLLIGTDNKNFFTNYEEAEAAIDGMIMPGKSVAYDLVHASNYMIDVCDNNCEEEKLDKNIITMYHITNDDKIVGSVGDAKRLIHTVENSAYTDENDEPAYRINVSVICPNGKVKDNSYVRDLVDASMGICYSNISQKVQAQLMMPNLAANNNEQDKTTVDTIKKNVVEICGEGYGSDYRVISSIGNDLITLDTPLRENKYYTSKSKKPTDTDRDGIWDWDEVCIEALEEFRQDKISDGVIYAQDMPSLLEVIAYYNKHGKGYVSSGYEKYMHEKSCNKGNPYSALIDLKILPLNSNPADIDSDDDGFLDNAYVNNYANVDEKNKIPYEWVKKSDKYFNVSDPNPLKKEIIWQWPLLDTNENRVCQISSGFHEHRKEKGNYHCGIDILTDKNVGYPVVAAYDGILKSICTTSDGGCTIEIEHTINGEKFTSSYMHMAYYESYTYAKRVNQKVTYDNTSFEFVDALNAALKNAKYEATVDSLSKKYKVEQKIDYTKLNFFIKAGTKIGVASGTASVNNKEGYALHLDFKVRDSEGNYINPITFMRYFDSSKNNDDGIPKEYNCDFYINVPKGLYNYCAFVCDCKNEENGGETYEIRNKYKIDYSIVFDYK